LQYAHANPFLHQNKPSRELIICGGVSSWWVKQVPIMLKFVLKRLQIMFVGWDDESTNWWIEYCGRLCKGEHQ